ncbi:MAG TPA: multidrug effflux MFS transporter [SAR324 cluster bacterium]|nr:multidrug effflux MFS transporter [SAR324 cluster bacterium]MEE1577557.1 multidrug effflux MFS transporter [Deltaproteobacteria bacterium]MDP6246322.1 multidrug effflux MFS transporter [SAR324 cluster bacterium]MDP7335376.1 multidrug effflux MFS transporter [SAR324 cluster bacterium]MDP7497877.1 multidrug effflux MFS transporter [SAR324 cluster bacterium]
MNKERSKMGFLEFVTLTAVMQSMTALTIDAMLPALPEIGRDLSTSHPNDVQLVILIMLLGFGLGQILYGPVSDSIGRKPPIYVGFAIYVLGGLVCIFSQTLFIMLCGRFLQGVGIASPRIVMNAVIRDRFKGAEMARVMSFVMAVFILIPVIAPSIGQLILIFFNWQAIFWMFLLFSVLVLTWFSIRLPETLLPLNRKVFSLHITLEGVVEVIRTRTALGYTLATGFLFSPFVGYLSSAQQIFADGYGKKDEFPLLFASLALTFGVASLVNARLVYRFGLRKLCFASAAVITGLSTIFLFGILWMEKMPSLWLFMAFMMVVFPGIAFLFGNLNALAMEPLGHIAGVGAAVIGSLSSLISIPLGIVIARAFNGTVLPLVTGFAICGLAVLFSIIWAEKTSLSFYRF